MLYVFGFEKVGVVFGDLYFRFPNNKTGGAERGVRLEVRLLKKGQAEGSPFGSRRISAIEPLWRVDLLEAADGPPGAHDRTHHHPVMHNWNGNGRRVVEPELSKDPVAWVAKALSDLDWLLEDSDFGPEDVDPDDARQLREAAPEICETLSRLLARVENGELANRPESDDGINLVHTGWM